MTKYSLYNAIGEINEKYIKDVLLEESEAHQYAHLSESSSHYERTIVMDVVRKKKRNRIFIAAVVLIMTAVTAAVAGLLKKDNREENGNENPVKYFNSRSIEMPEMIEFVDNGYLDGDDLYLVCYYDADKEENTFEIKDAVTGEVNTVRTDTETGYIFSSAVSEKCIYIADRDEKNGYCIKAIDRNTGVLLKKK